MAILTSSPGPPPVAARIRRIAVKGLFGAYNHVIQLRDDARVTIVLGPNGVGKTQLLEAVAALFHGRLERLVSVPFAVLDVTLEDGTTIRVEQIAHEVPQPEPGVAVRRSRIHRRGPRRKLTLQLFREEAPASEPWDVSGRPEGELPLEAQGELPNWIHQIEFGLWTDLRTDRLMTTRELAVLYGLRESAFEAVPVWYKQLLDRANVRLIETQRLLRTERKHRMHSRRVGLEETPVRFAVRDVTHDIAERMMSAGQLYSRQAAALDETYVERFLAYQPAEGDDPGVLQEKLGRIAARRARLEKLALLAAERGDLKAPEQVSGISRDKRLALALYAADMDKKLQVLEPLAERLEKLLESINRKLRNKQLVFDANEGLVVETNFGRRQQVDLEHLSSGEQHELVMLHDLLFRVRRSSLVAIDEPELSLHPVWQQQFVEDLITIAEASEFDVILATHSPYIVGERKCLTLSDAPAAAGVK